MMINIDHLPRPVRMFLNDVGEDSVSTEHSMAIARTLVVGKQTGELLDKLNKRMEIDTDAIKSYVKAWERVYAKPREILPSIESGGVNNMFQMTLFSPNELKTINNRNFIEVCNGYMGALYEL